MLLSFFLNSFFLIVIFLFLGSHDIFTFSSQFPQIQNIKFPAPITDFFFLSFPYSASVFIKANYVL